MATEMKILKLGAAEYAFVDETARTDTATLKGYFQDKSSQMASASAPGFMSKDDFSKLAGIEAGANKTGIAKTDALGAVQVGSGLAITDTGVLSVQAGGLPIATSTSLGAIMVGSTLSIDSTTGELNAVGYSLPIASTTALGGVKIAATSSSIAVDGTSGIISVVNDSHTHTTANVTGLDTALSNKLETSLKGAASGLAELGADGRVPTSQLPSYVDDVIEGYYDSASGKFYKDSAKTEEITPESGKIYIDLPTNKTYRWSGTAYVEISASLALGETESTAYRGDRGKAAYDHSQVADGTNPHATTFANIVDNIAKTDKLGGIKVGANLAITAEGVLSGNYANATTTAAGLMSDTDKTKLDGIEAGANKYILPTASGTDLGGVKVGTNLAIDANGILSGNYSDATTTTAGLMSATDKTKLDNVVSATFDSATSTLTLNIIVA